MTGRLVGAVVELPREQSGGWRVEAVLGLGGLVLSDPITNDLRVVDITDGVRVTAWGDQLVVRDIEAAKRARRDGVG